MTNLFRYLKLSFIQDLKKTMAYPVSFWLVVFIIPLYSLIQILFLESIYSQTGSFLGYSKYQAYVLFGSFTLVQTLGHLFFYNRLTELKDLINGWSQESFDLTLIKPVDSQVFATLGRYNFGNIAPFFVSLALVYYGLSHQPFSPDIFQLVSYVFIILLATVFFYLSLLFLSTFLFWLPDLQTTEGLWDSVLEFGQYPSGLYQGSLGFVLNILIPVTLMASVPTDFIFGQAQPYLLAVYALVIAVLIVLTRLFWTTAIKKYSSSSS